MSQLLLTLGCESMKKPCPYCHLDLKIEEKNTYSLWGWFLLCFGITAKPKRKLIICASCHRVIDELK